MVNSSLSVSLGGCGSAGWVMSPSSAVREPREAGSVLTSVDVDGVLAGLASAVATFHADWVAAMGETGRWEAAEEALLGTSLSTHGVARAVAASRWSTAAMTQRKLRSAGRELVAWWADLATYAALAAVRGVEVDATRAMAAEPGRFFGPELLARLPAVDEHHHLLAGLAVRLGAAGPGRGDDLPELARDMAARAGLRVHHHPDVSAEIVEDGSTDGRRCRLWGELWTGYQIPVDAVGKWIRAMWPGCSSCAGSAGVLVCSGDRGSIGSGTRGSVFNVARAEGRGV